MKPYRIAIVISHPIQHFCPQYTSWATLPGVELKVFFASNHGLAAYEDKGFGRVVKWDGIKLDFSHEFLRGAEGKAVGNAIDAPDLAERLSAFSPDVVMTYGYAQALQRRALRWAKSSSVPVLMFSDSELRAARSWARRAEAEWQSRAAQELVGIYAKAKGKAEEGFRINGKSSLSFFPPFLPSRLQTLPRLYYSLLTSYKDNRREG